MKVLEEIKKGDYIGENYEVYRVLGGPNKSGMGIVFICYDHESNNIVALKTLQTRKFIESLFNKQTFDLFKREAYIWMQLEEHPNIVRALAYDFIDNIPFIILEYIAPDQSDRNTLEHYLEKKIPIEQSLKWGIQFCYGMGYAQSLGVTPHRDIKPANLMITIDKTLKITDFGLTSILDQKEIIPDYQSTISQNLSDVSFMHCTQGGMTGGTIGYMAPEQFDGKTDLRSDIFSFGIVLYQMVNMGKHPYLEELKKIKIFIPEELKKSIMNIEIPHFDSELSNIIQKCLEKDPENRYQRFEDLRRDLEKIYEDITGEMPPPPPEKEELLGVEVTRKADSFLYLNLFDAAIEEYRKALGINPYNDDAYFGLGNCFRAKNECNSAIENYKETLRINPNNFEAISNLGYMYLRTEKVNEANKVIKKNLKLYPDNDSFHLIKGNILQKKKLLDKAIKEYREVVRLKNEMQNIIAAHYYLGFVLTEKCYLRESVKEFKNFLEYAPKGHPDYGNIINLTRNLEDRLAPSINPNYFQRYDKKTFDLMLVYFIPVTSTNIYSVVPENDVILSSFICSAKRTEKSGNVRTVYTWASQVLITKFGIAFRNRFNFNEFHYWNRINISMRLNGFKFRGNIYSLARRFRGIEFLSFGAYNVIARNLSQFHISVSSSFKYFIANMKDFKKKSDLLRDYIEEKGVNSFINDAYTFSNSVSPRSGLLIIENACNLIHDSKNLLNFKYYLLYTLKRYQDALDTINEILRLYPNDPNALYEKRKIEFIAKYFSISLKYRNKAFGLERKGTKKARKGKYEKVIIIYDKALDLDPYNLNVWNLKILALKALDRFEEANECSRERDKYSPPSNVNDDYYFGKMGLNLSQNLVIYRKYVDKYLPKEFRTKLKKEKTQLEEVGYLKEDLLKKLIKAKIESQTAPNTCHNCGKEIKANEKFCTFCGTPRIKAIEKEKMGIKAKKAVMISSDEIAKKSLNLEQGRGQTWEDLSTSRVRAENKSDNPEECWYCRAKVKAGAKYCEKCGKELYPT